MFADIQLARRIDGTKRRSCESARTRDADFTLITTAPGTQSQANVMKRGFRLLYSRAILVH